MKPRQRDPRSDRSSVRPRLALLATALLALLFFAGTLAAPLLESADHRAAAWVRLAYTPLCHQIAERSLEIAGHPQAVCARCSGLYLGAVAGLFLAALASAQRQGRPRPVWLAAAVAPTALDLSMGTLGLPALSNVPRLVLAWPAGFVAALFLAVGIAELFARSNTETSDAVALGGSLEVADG